MKATIFSHKDIIGTTDLEVGDFSMGGLFGNFYPNEIYFDKVQKYVWKFWASPKVNYEEWNSLNFNVQLENGMFLMPVGGITFDDIEELKSEPKRIDLAGIDTKIIEEPWEAISIDEKLAFEIELSKETNTSGSYLNIFNPKRGKHILSEVAASAFCKDSTADNILFEIHSKVLEQRFALVHLTWSGKSESAKFPQTELFADFDEFKHCRMYPGRNE
ncbi:hypothetical protein [Sphingobacterium hotanense]|uniref:hypothetical protein n=1 Tax=Sphingobacterium hotanense TaxID=649196 RepID=UPI0021A7B86F|nr:hypothetical protein [Sphingobacterium hotanense]MCT1526965.1 hypothetical protein [Sphingobacterium hotanense]